MITTVQCPSCETSFPVDTDKVPRGGVNARCSVCPTVFQVEGPPFPDEADTAVPDELPEAAPTPDSGFGAEEAAEGVVVPEEEPGEEPTGEPEAEPAEMEPEPEPWAGAGFEVGLDIPEAEEEVDVDRANEADREAPHEEGSWTGEEIAADQEAPTAPGWDEGEPELADSWPEGAEPPVAEAPDEEVWTGAWDVPGAGADVVEAEPVETEASGPRTLDADVEAEPEIAEPEIAEPEAVEGGEDAADPARRTGAVPDAMPAPAEPPAAFQFGKRDPHEKAQRLARVLVSDMIMYNPERHGRALDHGTLEQDFEDEIRKSWDEYVDQVGEELAVSTTYFRDALNDILARGERIFEGHPPR